jgi:GTP-binding protein HflX
VVDAVERAPGVRTPRVFLSARDGFGLDALRSLIAEQASAGLKSGSLPTLVTDPPAFPTAA